MSYLRAEEILPKEVLELVQQYADGVTLYIPKKERNAWGDGTNTKEVLKERNHEMTEKHLKGASFRTLSEEYFLTEKSVRRIIKSVMLSDPPESRRTDGRA